eukprot:326270_1
MSGQEYNYASYDNSENYHTHHNESHKHIYPILNNSDRCRGFYSLQSVQAARIELKALQKQKKQKRISRNGYERYLHLKAKFNAGKKKHSKSNFDLKNDHDDKKEEEDIDIKAIEEQFVRLCEGGLDEDDNANKRANKRGKKMSNKRDNRTNNIRKDHGRVVDRKKKQQRNTEIGEIELYMTDESCDEGQFIRGPKAEERLILSKAKKNADKRASAQRSNRAQSVKQSVSCSEYIDDHDAVPEHKIRARRHKKHRHSNSKDECDSRHRSRARARARERSRDRYSHRRREHRPRYRERDYSYRAQRDRSRPQKDNMGRRRRNG